MNQSGTEGSHDVVGWPAEVRLALRRSLSVLKDRRRCGDRRARRVPLRVVAEALGDVGKKSYDNV